MHLLVVVLMAAFTMFPTLGNAPATDPEPAVPQVASSPLTAEATADTGCPVGWYEFEVGANNPFDVNGDGIICMRESGMWGFGHIGRPTDNDYGP